MDTFFFVLGIIGVISFSISGAMVAIDRQTDVFGVVFLAVVTTFGGGMTRDLLMGNVPPRIFSDGVSFAVSVATALLVFFFVRIFSDFYRRREALIYTVNNIFDALGIGIFAVTGAAIALESPVPALSHPVAAAILGMVSAVGGGMIRDIVLRDIPFVLRKRIYALATLGGAALYVLLVSVGVGAVVASLAGTVLTFAVRMFATVFKWNLPKAIRQTDSLPVSDPQPTALSGKK